MVSVCPSEDHQEKRCTEEMSRWHWNQLCNAQLPDVQEIMEGSSRMCVRKAFTLTLFLAGNPVGKTPSCLCVQIPEAGTAGGAEAGAAQLPRCSCGKEMKLFHSD